MRNVAAVPRAAIIDVDGTLVDSNYHHTLAWWRALREHDLTVPLWTLHRHVGMGGDRYVAAVAGDEVEARLGDRLRARWEELFDEVIGEIVPLPGARELVRELKRRGHPVVLASSSVAKHVDRFLDLLELRDLADAWTTKDDVSRSKPEPDLVRAALDRAGTRDAVMVGDTPYDCEAARRAGIPTIGVLSGGFAEAELRDGGAAAIYPTAEELLRGLDASPLAA